MSSLWLGWQDPFRFCSTVLVGPTSANKGLGKLNDRILCAHHAWVVQPYPALTSQLVQFTSAFRSKRQHQLPALAADFLRLVVLTMAAASDRDAVLRQYREVLIKHSELEAE